MRYLKYVGYIVLTLLVIAVGWGFVEPRLLDVEHENVVIANLPEAWDGKKVAQLSDWQVGIWAENLHTVNEAVAAIVGERPSAVLLTGDFVYHPGKGEEADEELREVAAAVRPLVDSGIPTYAVLGNHDYAASDLDAEEDHQLARRVSRTLERAGVRVLVNEAVALPWPDPPSDARQPPLYLVGVGSRYAKNDQVQKALEDVPERAPRLAMMHHPDSFALFPADTAPLAVAGHTHGGQVRIPGLPQSSWLTFAKADKVHVDGWIRDYGAPGNQLYVNRGIGMSVLPIRINCRPELTFFTLERGAEPAKPWTLRR